jgi:siroheme synthase
MLTYLLSLGDPELLTLKAHKAINNADVVIVDYLLPEPMIAMIPKHVEVIRRVKSKTAQTESNQIALKRLQEVTGMTRHEVLLTSPLGKTSSAIEKWRSVLVWAWC